MTAGLSWVGFKTYGSAVVKYLGRIEVVSKILAAASWLTALASKIIECLPAVTP